MADVLDNEALMNKLHARVGVLNEFKAVRDEIKGVLREVNEQRLLTTVCHPPRKTLPS